MKQLTSSNSDSITSRILRILVAFDIFIFSVFTLGTAKRNETVSAAAWSLEVDRKWQGRLFRPIIDFLFLPFQRNHCLECWLEEQRELP